MIRQAIKAGSRSPVIAAIAVILFGIAAGARAQPGSAAALEKFSGVYQVAPGRFIYIQPWPGGEGKLLYTGEDGQLRALSEAAANVFLAGPGLLLSTPVEMQIRFVEDSQGRITRLTRRGNEFPETVARKLASYRHEDVAFRNGKIRLAGALFMPPGKGPHPALVLIHGSGRTDRNNVLPIVHFLITHGVALLGYDKRGIGGSGGDWRTASMEDLAGDAVAAVRFLKTRNGIDPHCIGVIGASQGGWIAPLAASRSRAVAFVISVSGPSMSPAEVELARLKHELRERGFSGEAVKAALKLLETADDVARGKQNWASYRPLLERAKSANWFRYAAVPLTPDSRLFEHWRRLPLDYDPGPVIAKVHVPVLAMFGALDQTVLARKNAAGWEAALREGGNSRYTIKIFPNADHMLLEARTGAANEYLGLKRFVPQYAVTLLGWLRKRGIVAE